MAQLIVAVGYAVVGVVVAVLVYRRTRSGRLAFTAIFVWPFVLPTLFVAAGSPTQGELSARAERIRVIEATLADAWRQTARDDQRERKAVGAFVDRLLRLNAELERMDALSGTATPLVRERLLRLREARMQELADGVRLLDELSAQLVLLGFAVGPSSGRGAERVQVEELVARMEALAELNAP